jgi:SAM-dependent methyltransferase
MIKYALAALALKGFSSTSQTRQLYRHLGNTYGANRRLRGSIPDYYLKRIERLLRLDRDYHCVKDGHRIIEIGTGWLHWESMTIKLFYDVRAVLFDVWDNRQFEALKHYARLLGPLLESGRFELSPPQRDSARSVLSRVLAAGSIDKLYEELGFQYVLDGRGLLDQFPPQAFDIVISAGVLEHVHKEQVGYLVGEFYRVLKPGGFSIHSINIGDHLFSYDGGVSQKEYLRFSDRSWKTFFQNEVQYFNRIQKSEWSTLLAQAGLTPVEEEVECVDMKGLKVHDQFGSLSREDVECVSLKVVHTRPAPH